MSTEKLQRAALYTLCVAALAALLWIGAKYVLPLIFPFAVACALSCFVRPAVEKLSEKTKLRRGFWAIIIIFAATALLCWGLFAGAALLVSQAGEAAAALSELLSGENNPVSLALDKLTDFFDKINVGDISAAGIGDAASGMLSSALSALTAGTANLAGRFLSAAPSFLFSFFVALIALFYFSTDREKLSREAKRFLPENFLKKASSAAALLGRALKKFIRAYGTIMLITFGELLAGFWIIGVDYAFLAAILTALVDVLPVLGAGTVIVPWALILFATGETGTAVKLLILLLIMWAVRQIIEPKIVGRGAGVHPYTALAAVYVGFRLCGVAGLIIAPVLLNAAAAILDERGKK